MKNNINKNKSCDISVILPLFNEEKNISILYSKLKDVLENLNKEYQIIFIDDGSVDKTMDNLLEIHEKDVCTKIIKLRRNFGQTAALSAGIDHADGNTIILMDADLQHDPEDIPKFVEYIDKGYDIVSGWRKNRVDNFWLRRLPSLAANWIMSKLSGLDLHDFGTTFKAYRREVIKNVKLYGDFHRFIPVLANRFSASIIEIPINNTLRKEGKSNYGLSRTFTVFFDLIRINFLSKYLSKPLQFFGLFGLSISFIGFLIAFYLAFMKYVYGLGLMVYRPPLFILSILLIIIGIQFLILGLLGEIIVKVYHESGETKTYHIEKIFE